MKSGLTLRACFSIGTLVAFHQPVWVSGFQSTVVVSSQLTLSRPTCRSVVLVLQAGLPDDFVLPAHDALRSPKMAQTIRRRRSTRGKSTPGEKKPTMKESPKLPKKSAKRIKAHLPKQESMEKSLRSNGIDLPYDITFEALKAYHSLNGDLVLPRRYVVPSQEPFPSDFHGLDLASSVYNMEWWQKNIKEKPERVAELNEIGFVWERLQPEWNLVLEALITHKTIHGHVLVPYKFVVPYGDLQWPKETWGLNLGNIVHRLRARNDFLRGPNSASRRDQLDGLGFVWDVDDHRFQLFYASLVLFARINRCGRFSQGRTEALRVPSTFVIPSHDLWPKELWGFPLGVKCNAVRQKELYVKNKPERQRLLEELGFRWSGNADLGWLQVVHAAAIFSRMNNRTLDVPYHFVVPSPADGSVEDWPWPDYLWGLPLGQRLKDVRLKGAYLHGDKGISRKQQLDTLGFVWKPKRGRKKSQQNEDS